MHIPSIDAAAPRPAPREDRARDRLDRVARTAPESGPGHRETAPRRRHGTGKREPFRLGWVGWVVVQTGALALVAAAVLVWPPARACREQEAKIGFYAGDTLGKCIHRGVADRIDTLDQRLKMAVRGSGK